MSSWMREYGPGWVLIGCLVFSVAVIDRFQESRVSRQEHARLRSHLKEKAWVFQGVLQSTLDRTLALEAFVLAQPDFDDSAFQVFSRRLRSNDHDVRSLQLAPEGRIRHVHPVSGNEGVLGLDLLGSPRDRPLALRAIRERSLLVAGPFRLRQGGIGLIGRRPMFLHGKFWGFSTVVIGMEGMLEHLGDWKSDPLSWGAWSLAGDSALFLGGDSSILPQHPVFHDILLPGATVRIAAIPRGGWTKHWAGHWILWASLAGLILPIWILLRRLDFSSTQVLRGRKDLQELLEAAPLPILEFDEDHLPPRLMNQALRDFLGLQPGAIPSSGTLRKRLFPQEEDPESTHSSDSTTSIREMKIPDKDGNIRVFQTHLSWRGAHPLAVLVDLTDLRQSQDDLLEARLVAERANRAKSRFLAHMSHELRTPMNAILGFARLLSSDSLPPTSQHQARRIEDAARSLLGILNDILDLSKIEAERMILEKTPFRPSQIAEDLRDLFGAQARNKGLVLDIQTRDLPEALAGDPLRFRQTLVNLVGNAIKFTASGSVTVNFFRGTAEAEIPQDHFPLGISVADTGIGMNNEQLSTLFEPFSQADASTSRRFGGTGLGLAITRRLVDLMGGTLEVRSVPRQGSEFSFQLILPLAVPEDLAPPPSTGLLPRGLRILLVEDYPVNRLLAEEVLHRLGAEVETLENGAVALDRLRKDPHSIDIVLMDVQMPIMDGLEATRRLRSDPRTNDLPIVAMTAGVLDAERGQCREAGMDGFIAKPFEIPDLTASILSALEKRKRLPPPSTLPVDGPK
ncbi:MAG: response regulator [Fibrobacteria bacterium]|nr:response regulator [Fibrobacteria bacterium]